MSNFLLLTVYGLADGAILALAALGFVLIYKATRVINFAQGEFLLFGAYMFYTAFVVMRLPWILASVVGVIGAIILVSSSSASSCARWSARARSASSW